MHQFFQSQGGVEARLKSLQDRQRTCSNEARCEAVDVASDELQNAGTGGTVLSMGAAAKEI